MSLRGDLERSTWQSGFLHYEYNWFLKHDAEIAEDEVDGRFSNNIITVYDRDDNIG